MPKKQSRPAETVQPESAARIVGRIFFATTAGMAFISAGLLAVLPHELPLAWRLVLVASLLLLAVSAGLAVPFSFRKQFPTKAALCGTAIAGLLLIGLVNLALKQGVRSPGLGLFGLIVCIVTAITGVRYGIALAALAVAEMVALAWAETIGWVDGGGTSVPLAILLVYQGLGVLCGAIGGGMMAQAFERYRHVAAERERRFHGLLRLGVDWYWERDLDFRFTYLSEASSSTSGGARSDHKIRAPWEISELGLTEEQLAAHHADLQAHRSFHGLRARCPDGKGRWRTVRISGEPRHDAQGVFSGYWGVARDVTAEMRARRAVIASETRYRELFSRSPSPLFLHRRGIVFEANEAAARMFGFEDAAAMNGCNVIDLLPPGAMRDHIIERVTRLDAMPVGSDVPIIDFQVRSIDGRALSVQATAVRVDTASGPANLSIFFDITARKAVEGALRSSEAMLSHLFATSPDCIMLTEMSSGRYEMVNPAFCNLTGFSADEVVGRTAAELGLWHEPEQFDRLLAQLDRDTTVIELPAVFVAKSGERVSMLLAAGRFVMDRRDYLVINARDVTESERTRLQHIAILEHASIGIAFTRQRCFVQANPCFEQMFGWGSGELLGKEGLVVWANATEYQEFGQLAGPPLSAGLPFELERLMCRKDGTEFWCRLLAQAVDRGDPSRGGTIWITEDVTERRRLDAALAAARDAAEAASQAKSTFLANTSHEIRTPLNGLLGLARLAMRDGLAVSRRQQYLAQILDSAQSLAGIMTDILDVSKIEAGKIVLEDTPFDLRETLLSVHHTYQSLAEVKGLTLLLLIDEAVPTTVRGDAVRVRQILSNFITNALKFTERGQVRIEVSAARHGALRLAVSDTGPGVERAMQERLFTPFSQGDSSTTRRFGGTGLGLSICRELAQLMGGSVGVHSSPEGGSTFWAEVSLPRATAVPAIASTEAADIECLKDARVLMVEDNPVNMMIAVAMLEQWGVRVAQAFDGRSAVEAVESAAQRGDPFEAVLMDVQMPVMSGHEAARELRRHYPVGRLAIIALTAAALVSERDEALQAGMDDFLTKPIDPPKLRHTLAMWLAERRRFTASTA